MLRNIRNREIGKKVKLPNAKAFIIKKIRALDKDISRKILVGITRPALRDQIKLEIAELKRTITGHRKFLYKTFGFIMERKHYEL